MWLSSIQEVDTLILLINPKTLNNEKYLVVACVDVFVSLWIDKSRSVI